MRQRHLLCASLALGFVGHLSAQQIWNVNCQGSPVAHFTDLPQAVAAAAAGDEVRVYVDASLPSCPGLTYYTAPIIDKPLRIVGFRVGPGVAIPGANVRGGILIVGLAVGERLVLSNLSIGQGSGPSGIVALNCQGSILLENCEYGSNGSNGSYMRFENCAEVVMRGCDIRLGGSPLEVINSNLLISNSSVYQGPPLLIPAGPYSQTAEGLRVINSTVTITESIVEGSDGYNLPPSSNYVARAGIIVDSGTVRVGPGALVRGGQHVWGAYAPGYLLTSPSASIERDSRGTIVVPTLPPPIPIQLHTMAHGWVTAGAAYTALGAGPPGGFAVLAVGDWLPGGMPTPLGSLQIDPATLQIGAIVPLSPTDGRYLWSLNCPATIPVAHAFAFQAAVLSPTGVLSLTVPSPFAVGWAATSVP